MTGMKQQPWFLAKPDFHAEITIRTSESYSQQWNCRRHIPEYSGYENLKVLKEAGSERTDFTTFIGQQAVRLISKNPKARTQYELEY